MAAFPLEQQRHVVPVRSATSRGCRWLLRHMESEGEQSLVNRPVLEDALTDPGRL